METQFTGKPGISGYTGNYSIATLTGFTSFAVFSGTTIFSGNTRKYGSKMLDVLFNSPDNKFIGINLLSAVPS
jgi:hypothetical protein